MTEAFPTLTERERSGLAGAGIDPEQSLRGFLAALMPGKTGDEIERMIEDGVRQRDMPRCALCRKNRAHPEPDPRLPGTRVPTCVRCRDWLAYWDGWSLEWPTTQGAAAWSHHRTGERVEVGDLPGWTQAGLRNGHRAERMAAHREQARQRRQQG